MDNRLKERLIGATVLVVAAVLFIPMVLDGPGGGGRVSQSVPLPASGTTGGERRTVRIDLARPDTGTGGHDEPVQGAVDEPVSVDLVPEQEKAVAQRETQPPEAVEPESETQSAAGVDRKPVEESTSAGPQDAPWTVQAGSFSQQDNAESLAARLRELDFPAYVSRYNDGERVHYRVRVGGFPSRDAAQAQADEIRGKTGEPARPAPAN